MNIVDKRKTTKFYELKVGDVFKCGEVTGICIADENSINNMVKKYRICQKRAL